jgi:hypothetical protein
MVCEKKYPSSYEPVILSSRELQHLGGRKMSEPARQTEEEQPEGYKEKYYWQVKAGESQTQSRQRPRFLSPSEKKFRDETK